MGQMAHLWIYFLYLQPRMHRIMLVRANDHYTSVVLILLRPEKRCGNSGDTFMWPRVPGKEETAEGSLGTVIPGKWQVSGLTWERSVCSLRWRRYSGTRVLAIEEKKKEKSCMQDVQELCLTSHFQDEGLTKNCRTLSVELNMAEL